MLKEIVNPKELGTPLSKYSHAVVVNVGSAKLIFVTGQQALDSHGKVVAPSDISAQTEYVFESVHKILASCGATFRDIVKVTIFVTDMKLYPKVAEIRNKYFTDSPPASTLVEVKGLVSKESLIELEVIAATEVAT